MQMSERSYWGKANIGVPAHAVRAALQQAAASSELHGVRFDAIDYYFDRLLFGQLVRVIDEALSVEQLRAMHPDVIKVVYTLLIRDLCRHYRRPLGGRVLDRWEGQWVERLTLMLLKLTDAPIEPYVHWMRRQRADVEEDTRVLIAALARQLHVEPQTLYDYHLAMCKVVAEDMLAPRGRA